MPSNRTPIHRARIPPIADDDTLALFERCVRLRRSIAEFYRCEAELDRRLGRGLCDPSIFKDGDDEEEEVFPVGPPGERWREAAAIRRSLEEALLARRRQKESTPNPA
jgi:hypothetical protein